MQRNVINVTAPVRFGFIKELETLPVLMKDCFDFTNYTYSGILSLFTAVIGLSFPFILQVIHRLQDIYHTDKVLDWFTEENEYKRFFLLLRCSVVLAILMPLSLYLIGNKLWLSIILLTMQTSVTCLLLFCLIRLYQVVMAYSRCLQLAQRTDADDLAKITFLMLAADNQNNNEAYDAAKGKVYDTLYKRIISDVKNGHNKELNLQGDALSSINKIFASALHQTKYPQTSKDITIIDLLYDGIITKTHLSAKTYELIWRELNMMVKVRNDIWIQAYWERSSQYARSLKYSTNDYTSNEELLFRRRHYFLGALFLGAGYDEMVKYILRFNDASPEPPRLLPTSLAEIVGTVIWADIKSSEPFGLAQFFQMYFIPIDVNVDSRIYDVLCDYFVLSLLLLPTYKMYGSFNASSYKIPQNTSKEEVEHLRQLVNHLKIKFETDAQKYAQYMPRYSNYENCLKEAHGYLEDLLSQCDTIEADIENNDDVDSNKLERMKSEIKKEYERQKIQIRKGVGKWKDREEIQFTISSKGQASEGQLMKRQNLSCINFETVLVSMLRNHFCGQIARQFLYNSPRTTILIQYKDISEALSRLQIDASFVLVNMGVSLWNVDVMGLRVVNLGSGDNTLYLMKEEDAPTYTLEKIDCKNGLQILDDKNQLYWIEPSKQNDLFVTLVQSVVLHKPKWMKYIKINITYDTALGSCSLGKIDDTKTILK